MDDVVVQCAVKIYQVFDCVEVMREVINDIGSLLHGLSRFAGLTGAL